MATNMSLITFHFFPRLPQEIQITILHHAAHIDHSRLGWWPRPGKPDQSYRDFFMSGFILILRYLNEIYPDANLDHFKWNVAMEWRGYDAYATRLSLMKMSVLARRVAIDAWRADLLDITTMEDIEGHSQYHMDIVLEDHDKKLDCIREGEGGPDLVKGVLGCHCENGSREVLVTQERL